MPRGVPLAWQHVPPAQQAELRMIYCDLLAQYGLTRVRSRRLARRYAKTAAEILATVDVVSEEAAVLALRRQAGRGRRPSLKRVRASGKTAGLQLKSLQAALGRLEALAGPNGHGQDLATRFAEHHREAGRA
jgi:hypothetical protein